MTTNRHSPNPDSPDTPDTDPETFDAPWQARAFAIAVALTERGSDDGFPWRDFQQRLVAAIEQTDGPSDDPESTYYDQWVAALEQLLYDKALVTPGEVADRAAQFESGERDASEFVEGDPHAHSHDHHTDHH